VNKTGSRSLAVLCAYYNKPIYALTSRNKMTFEKKYIPEEKDPSEVWRYSAENLTIKNVYFEEVEGDLITKVITD
jgi:translation initiation factor 2B subunit (eIF-2B alpha/beta/delta family)